MRHVNEVIEQHSPGHQEKMRLLTVTGSPPVRTGTTDELMRVLAYQSELLVGLADLVDLLVKEGAPKKRGRPRKDAA
jgi:hypothetical protein